MARCIVRPRSYQDPASDNGHVHRCHRILRARLAVKADHPQTGHHRCKHHPVCHKRQMLTPRDTTRTDFPAGNHRQVWCGLRLRKDCQFCNSHQNHKELPVCRHPQITTAHWMSSSRRVCRGSLSRAPHHPWKALLSLCGATWIS